MTYTTHGTADAISTFEGEQSNSKDHGWPGRRIYLTDPVDVVDGCARVKLGSVGSVVTQKYAYDNPPSHCSRLNFHFDHRLVNLLQSDCRPRSKPHVKRCRHCARAGIDTNQPAAKLMDDAVTEVAHRWDCCTGPNFDHDRQ